MTGTCQPPAYGRIEDFIQQAHKGKKVTAQVSLRQETVRRLKIPKGKRSSRELETYLLIGEYTFTVGRRKHTVAKVYMFAAREESPEMEQENRSIANARLRMDYERLKAAGIPFEEKFF